MSQGPEGFAATLTRAVSVLTSVCGAKEAARATRFKQAISVGDSEPTQVAQLAKVLCSFTIEEGISELSETLTSTTNDSLHSSRQDALATDVVRDDVFLSLVKHATTTEAVCWLCHAMRRITTGDDAATRRRQDIFATEAVRDGFFMSLVKHATSPEAVYSLSRAMCNITAGTDAGTACRKDIFATDAVRDGFFVPLVKSATSTEACRWVSTAMYNITAGTDASTARRKDIFATESVRDGFFVPLVKHATSAEAVDWLSSAMCNITTGTDAGAARRKDIFATESVRDGFFVPLVQHATSAEAVDWLSSAMCNITTGTDAGAARRSDSFATESVRDGFFVPLVKHATSTEACRWVSTAMRNITTGTDAGAARRKDIFATESVRDGFFVPLVKHATSAEAVDWLSSAMCNITAGTDASTARRKDIFATESVRDGFFVPLVQHATSAEAVDWLSSAMCNITTGTDAGAARRKDIFATESVRDGFFVLLVKHAASTEAVEWLSSAMCNITAGTDAGAARRKDIFATEAVRDGFFLPLAKHATSAEACQWLSQACHSVCRPNPSTGVFGLFSAPDNRRAMTFATPVMRDGFFLVLAQALQSREAVNTEENGKAADLLLTTFRTIARGDGVSPKDFVTPELAAEFVRLLESFRTELSKTAVSVRELLAQVYPLTLHPLCAKAQVSKTKIPKDTPSFWELEEVFKAGLNGHNDDYVEYRLARRLPPLTFVLVGATAVSNPVLEKRFEVMKSIMEKSGGYSEKELRERWSFHGTRPRNIDGILTTSLLPFKHPLNPCENTSDDGFFGVNTDGVYVGRYVDYVLKYSNQEAPLKLDDEVDVIMFKTLPGKSKHIEQISLLSVKILQSSSLLRPPPESKPRSAVEARRAAENKRTWADDGLAPL